MEQHARIDARELARLGAFRDFWRGSITRDARGDLNTIALLQGWSDGLHVTCARQSSFGTYEEVVHDVEIERVALRYGGDQPYFRCPGCRLRVLILLIAFGEVGCRRCLRLVYAVTSEGPEERALRKAFKLRRLLGGKAVLMADPPPRPRGMSWRRYWLARRRLVDAECAYWSAAAGDLGLPLLSRT